LKFVKVAYFVHKSGPLSSILQFFAQKLCHLINEDNLQNQGQEKEIRLNRIDYFDWF